MTARHIQFVTTFASLTDVPPMVDGKWLRTVSGALVWATPTAADVGALDETTGDARYALTSDARLSDARTPLDGSVTTAKLADGAVTAVKVAADVATKAYVDSVSGSSRLAADAPVATVSDLVAANGVVASQATALSLVAFVAQEPCNVVQAVVVVEGPVTASDTNYWTVVINRYRAGAASAIASKTTKTASSSGEAMTADRPWSFNAVAFSSSAQACEQGDVVRFTFTPTGTPASLVNPFVQVRYEPL